MLVKGQRIRVSVSLEAVQKEDHQTYWMSDTFSGNDVRFNQEVIVKPTSLLEMAKLLEGFQKVVDEVFTHLHMIEDSNG